MLYAGNPKSFLGIKTCSLHAFIPRRKPCERTLGVIFFLATPFVLYAFTYLTGSPDPDVIPRTEDSLYLYVILILILVAIAALFSCRYLRYEYLMTKRHIFVRKGKKYDQYCLGLIRNIKVKEHLRMSFFGTSLEIHFASPLLLKENTQFNPTRGGTSIRFEYIEDPYMVKNTIDLWAMSAKSDVQEKRKSIKKTEKEE